MHSEIRLCNQSQQYIAFQQQALQYQALQNGLAVSQDQHYQDLQYQDLQTGLESLANTLKNTFDNRIQQTFGLVIDGFLEAIHEAFEALHSIRKKLQDDLLAIKDNEDRRLVKYLIQRINFLRPMNACGYFEIDKTTLTSVVSIRYIFIQITQQFFGTFRKS